MEEICLDTDDEYEVETSDIENLCKEIAKSSNILLHANEPIQLSSDEETDVDKTWKEKLSQNSPKAEKMLQHSKAKAHQLNAAYCNPSNISKLNEAIKKESEGSKTRIKKFQDITLLELPAQTDETDLRKQKNEMNYIHDLKCVRTSNPFKIQIRRKSVSEREVFSTEKPNLRNNSNQEEAKKRYMPSRRMTICGSEDLRDNSAILANNNLTLISPTPIIDPPRTFKRRISTHELKATKRFEKTEEMVTIAKKMKTSMTRRRMSIASTSVSSASSKLPREEMEQIKRERAEKLRKIAEDQRKSDQNAAKLEESNDLTQRVVPKVKIKYTEKNRGDFLTSLPLVERPKKPNVTPAKLQQLNSSPEPVPSMITKFRVKHVTRLVSTATVDKGICNNLAFYNEMETDVEKKNSTETESKEPQPQGIGFYNQISFSQQPQISVKDDSSKNYSPTIFGTCQVSSSFRLMPILKTPYRKSNKKNVTFPEKDYLEEIRMYEVDEILAESSDEN